LAAIASPPAIVTIEKSALAAQVAALRSQDAG